MALFQENLKRIFFHHLNKKAHVSSQYNVSQVFPCFARKESLANHRHLCTLGDICNKYWVLVSSSSKTNEKNL